MCIVERRATEKKKNRVHTDLVKKKKTKKKKKVLGNKFQDKQLGKESIHHAAAAAAAAELEIETEGSRRNQVKPTRLVSVVVVVEVVV